MKLFANDFVKFYEELDAASILVENNFEVHSKDELDQENISNSQLTVEEQSEESTSIIDNTDNTVESVLKYLANVTNTDQISYKDLTLLFELYLKDQIKEGHKDLARTVWRNIRKVALQKKDPYGRGMYKALQYYYNAYLTEETAKAAIPELFYITGEEEHSTLHPDSRSTDAPDLAGNFLFGHSCKIEVKTYKDQAS